MTSTFVNDLRLNEMATGDQSGSWGTVTNTNLELIGEALGYGTEGITTNANTHTSTIADGATDPVRALYVEYTGTLDSACTITIAPNTVNKVCFIENGTSGSQNIIIKQGSGATITIPPGDTKAVYLDGAGSGAKVVDAFASLSVVDLKVQDDLTVTDDASVGGILGVTGVLTTTAATVFNGGFASNQESTIIAADGAADNAFALIVKNQEATDDRSFGLRIEAGSTATDLPLNIETHDGGTALFQLAGNGQARFLDGTASLPSISNLNGPDLNTGIFFPAADQVGIATGGTVRHTTSSLGIVGTGAVNIRDFDGFLGNIDHTANNTSMVISSGTSSTNATNVFWSDVHASFSGQIHNVSVSSNSGTVADAGLQAFWVYNGSAFVLNHYLASIAGQETCFNEASVDMDFRVESSGAVNKFFVDGAEDIISIGGGESYLVGGFKNSLQVVGTGATTSSISVTRNSNDVNPPYINFGKTRGAIGSVTAVNNNDEVGRLAWHAADGTDVASEVCRISAAIDGSVNTANDTPGRLMFATTANGNNGATERMRITEDGIVLIGETSANAVSNGTGIYVAQNGQFYASSSSSHFFNKQADGDILFFRSAGQSEGVISIDGSTTTYTGFSGRHESSGIPTNTPVGTVVSTIDALDVYPDTQLNPQTEKPEACPKAGQTRADHAKVEVSTSEGDACVYGVVAEFTSQDKLIVTSVGIGSVRVTGACSKGDLLESKGDGTAKVQSDDIVRSKTLGKVTIGNSNTGVKLVPCVMYCG